jgi:hypothetical protein
MNAATTVAMRANNPGRPVGRIVAVDRLFENLRYGHLW